MQHTVCIEFMHDNMRPSKMNLANCSKLKDGSQPAMKGEPSLQLICEEVLTFDGLSDV